MSDTRSAGGNWATETTLLKIAQNTGQTVAGLERLVNARLRGASKLDEGLTQTGEAARRASRTLRSAVDELSRDLRRQTRELGVSLLDPSVTHSLGRRLTGTSSYLDRLGSSSGGLLGKFTGLLRGLGPVGIGLNVFASALGFAVGVVTGLVKQLVNTNTTLIDLVRSGIMFNGSVIDFNVAVGRAGLTAEEFARIAQESAGGVRAFGEGAFLQATTRLSRVFGDFALNIQQGNEYFADYLETSRLAGHVYIGGMEAQGQAFQENIRLQHELAALTGKSVSEQRRAARARAEGAQYRLMMAALPEEERKRLEATMTTATGMGIPEELMRAQIMRFRFGRTTQEAGRFSALMPEMDEFFQRMATGQVPEREMGRELQGVAARFQTVMQDPSRMTTMLHMVGGSLNSTVEAIAGLIPTMTGLVNPTQEVQRALERLRAGMPPFAEDTRAINSAQDALKLIMTTINAEIMNFVGERGLRQILGVINQLGTAARDFVAANPDRKMQAFMESLEVPATSPLMTAARQLDQAQGFMETIRAVGNLLIAGLSEAATRLGNILHNWTKDFVETLRRDVLPWWLGGGGLTERQRAELATGQQTRIAAEQTREVAPGLTATGLPVQAPAIPERPSPGATREERRAAEAQLLERIAVLENQLRDLQYRQRPGERNEQIDNLIENINRSNRELRDIRRNTQG